MPTISDLLKKDVPFVSARDYITVKYWLDNGKIVSPQWKKRYEDIKAKYNLK